MRLRPDRPGEGERRPRFTNRGPRQPLGFAKSLGKTKGRWAGVKGGWFRVWCWLLSHVVRRRVRSRGRGVGTDLDLNRATPVASAGCIVQTQAGSGTLHRLRFRLRTSTVTVPDSGLATGPLSPWPHDRSGRYLTSRRMGRFVFSEPPKILKHGNPMHPYGHPPKSWGP